MGITNSNKQIDKDSIDCGGVLKVSIALSAAPDISSNPTDIVLILDRSGSMAGRPLANMKQGALGYPAKPADAPKPRKVDYYRVIK